MRILWTYNQELPRPRPPTAKESRRAVGCWKKPKDEDSRPPRYLIFDRWGFQTAEGRQERWAAPNVDSGSIAKLGVCRVNIVWGGKDGREEREGVKPSCWWRRGRRRRGKGRLTGECAQLRFLTGKRPRVMFLWARSYHTINRWAAKYCGSRSVIPFPRYVSSRSSLPHPSTCQGLVFWRARACVWPESLRKIGTPGIRKGTGRDCARQSDTSIPAVFPVLRVNPEEMRSFSAGVVFFHEGCYYGRAGLHEKST